MLLKEEIFLDFDEKQHYVLYMCLATQPYLSLTNILLMDSSINSTLCQVITNSRGVTCWSGAGVFFP